MKLNKQKSLRAVKWIAIFLAGLAFGWLALAQGITTTTVAGTVYLANGQPGSGTLTVSWPAFTTAASQAVAAGSLQVTLLQMSSSTAINSPGRHRPPPPVASSPTRTASTPGSTLTSSTREITPRV
jgi:hypothetical protein